MNLFVPLRHTALYIVLLTISILPFTSSANVLEEGLNLANPRNAIYTHLYYLQVANYSPEKATQALDTAGLSLNEAAERAIKLKRIYDGVGFFVEIDQVPDDPDYIDSAHYHHKRYTPLAAMPDIYLVKHGDNWVYSKETVQAIPLLYNQVFPLGMGSLVEFAGHLEEWGWHEARYKILDVELWQYAAVALLVISVVFGVRTLSSLIKPYLRKAGSNWLDSEETKQKGRQTLRTFNAFLILLLIRLFIPAISLPISINRYAFKGTEIASITIFFWFTIKFVNFLSGHLKDTLDPDSEVLNPKLLPLFRRLIKLVLAVLWGFYFLSALEYDITTLLAGISIGGLAVALAAQDTIKNLFGSVMIFADKPFRIGDWILGAGVDGNVEEIGFRSTRVRTFYNSVVSIPNGKIADMTIDNMGARRFRRFKTLLAITYDTPPDLIEKFVHELREMVLAHPQTSKHNFHIYLNGYGASSLDILFYIFFDVENWAEELNARHDVMLQTIRIAEKLNVRFAFPTTTLHMETFPEKASLTPKYPDFREEDREDRP